MSNRMTSIHLPGHHFGAGLSDWGRLTVPEMIKKYREHAEYNKRIAKAILAAKDEDFCVATYLGQYVQKKREVLQEGKQAELFVD